MEILLAIVIGVLYATGVYLLMRRTIVRVLLGVAILGNAANLMIFTVARVRRAAPPLVPEGQSQPPPGVADPLAQALILTAIVIGFGVLAFSLALARRTYQTTGDDNLDELNSTDQ